MVVAAFVATFALTAGLSGAFRGKNPSSGATQAAPSPPAPQSGVGGPASAADCNRNSFIATLQRRVFARSAPSAQAKALAVLRRRTTLGTPDVVLVLSETQGPSGATWYLVQLPTLPNGTVGYVPRAAVALAQTPYRLVLDRKSFSLTLYNACNVVKQYEVGLGTGTTRAPSGRFYLTALLRLPKADRLYGTYAYSLSGYTDTLARWASGGVVGLHGTQDAGVLGRRDARGSIAVSDAAIEELVKLLPLGTPIEIS